MWVSYFNCKALFNIAHNTELQITAQISRFKITTKLLFYKITKATSGSVWQGNCRI